MIIRIAQEAINNSLKHANARHLHIYIKYGMNEFQMAIKDDGVGFELAPQRSGVGLQSIYQRARVINGDIEVKSVPGNGTEILLTIANPVYG